MKTKLLYFLSYISFFLGLIVGCFVMHYKIDAPISGKTYNVYFEYNVYHHFYLSGHHQGLHWTEYTTPSHHEDGVDTDTVPCDIVHQYLRP